MVNGFSSDSHICRNISEKLHDSTRALASEENAVRSKNPSSFVGSRSLAAVAALGAFVVVPFMWAPDRGGVEGRIDAAFTLEVEDSSELTIALDRSASIERTQEEPVVPPRADGEIAAEESASLLALMAPPVSATLGAFSSGSMEAVRLPRPRPGADTDSEIVTGSLLAYAPSPLPEEEVEEPPPEPLPEVAYFDRFAGSFSGAGEVRRRATDRPAQVKCTLSGEPAENRILISGRCGASIFSREVSADIRYDPATGRYTGTYIGSNAGPARLSGARSGDAVVLTITWPKPVNGDTKATMTILNSGDGRLQITVTDEVRPGGAKTEVTRLALNQS
jgi:hypothetical protein